MRQAKRRWAYNNRAVACYMKKKIEKVQEDIRKLQGMGYSVEPELYYSY